MFFPSYGHRGGLLKKTSYLVDSKSPMALVDISLVVLDLFLVDLLIILDVLFSYGCSKLVEIKRIYRNLESRK
jgi:hypothetical protein